MTSQNVSYLVSLNPIKASSKIHSVSDNHNYTECGVKLTDRFYIDFYKDKDINCTKCIANLKKENKNV